MYSAPRPVAAASWTVPASGRASFEAARPIAAPPATQASPPTPVHSRNRRRDGSLGGPSIPRRAAHATRSHATPATTTPATSPTAMLPIAVTRAAVMPPKRTNTMRVRGGREALTPAILRSGTSGLFVDVCGVPMEEPSGSLALEVEERRRDDRRTDLASL